MVRRMSMELPAFVLLVALFYMAALLLGLASFPAERLRRAGMAPHAPVPAPGRGEAAS